MNGASNLLPPSFPSWKDRDAPRATGLNSKLLRAVKEGDALLVTRLDRLARSTRDLLNILAKLNEKKVGFRSIGDTWADTTTPHGRLILTLLGGIAEFERELIRIRTSEGRARAVANGGRLGRPPKMSLNDRLEASRKLAEGVPQLELARLYNVSPATISRLSCLAADLSMVPLVAE